MQAKRNGMYQCWWQLDGMTFTANVAEVEDDKEVRRQWRVMVNHIKAQLISVEEGLVSARFAMLPFAMLPDYSRP